MSSKHRSGGKGGKVTGSNHDGEGEGLPEGDSKSVSNIFPCQF